MRKVNMGWWVAVLLFTIGLQANVSAQSSTSVTIAIAETSGMKAAPQDDPISAVVTRYANRGSLIIISPEHGDERALQLALTYLSTRGANAPSTWAIRKKSLPEEALPSSRRGSMLAAVAQQPLRELPGFGLVRFLTIQ